MSDCEARSTSSVVVAKSSEASSRSSASASGSCSRSRSSESDEVEVCHACKAVVMGASSPRRLADAVSKVSATFVVRCACSSAAALARESSTDDSEPSAAGTVMEE